MNGTTDGSDGRPGARDRTTTVPLEAVVVRYEHRPDRRTLSPKERATRTAWLTADLEAFVDLDDAR
ncbi:MULTISPECIES: DUF7511 domain-containing protein [Saliphagus]|uniref:DUF7511 domain-containing protein n=1 Tax=Saliphagus infecundisoli TaxID=1849069 RepID=A0ABD5QF38_9EURY|nr:MULTISPECIES: hypothetical protein [Saliphagus]